MYGAAHVCARDVYPGMVAESIKNCLQDTIQDQIYQ